MRTFIVALGIVAALATGAQAHRPAKGEVCFATQADFDRAIADAIEAALEDVGSPTPSTIYQLCRMNRRGVCRSTRTYLRPVTE